MNIGARAIQVFVRSCAAADRSTTVCMARKSDANGNVKAIMSALCV